MQAEYAVDRRLYESHLNTVFLGSEYSPFGYAYIFPKRDRLDVGVGSLLSRAKGASLEKYLDKAAGHYGLTPESKPRYALVPLTGPVEKVCRGRVLLAGDSAGHVSPLVGEGIRFAMEAGSIAADAISSFLRGEFSLSELSRRYLAGLKKGFYRRLRLEKFLLRFLGRGRLTSTRLLRDPGMRRIVAELYLDMKDTQSLVLASIPRVLRRVLS